MTGFLSLSREIRNMVYELALVVDEIITPYDEHYPLEKKDLMFRNALPTVALLGVSKLVQLEATEYLYGKNTWRVTSKMPPASASSEYETLWALRAGHFKHVVMVLDQRDIDEEYVRVGNRYLRESMPGASLGEKMQELHSWADYAMKHSWLSKIHALAFMPNLASLCIEVGRLACHVGCCRLETLQCFLEVFDFHIRGCDHYYEHEERSIQNRVKAGLELTISGLQGKEKEEILDDSGFPATIV